MTNVTVAQEDREAAEALRGSPAYGYGFYDHTPLVQAFARHRTAAHAAGLAEGVAMGIEVGARDAEEKRNA
jgi:hypothetical protein